MALAAPLGKGQSQLQLCSILAIYRCATNALSTSKKRPAQ
jgi:hypothetical protein